jgi:hypothetical protein
MPLLTELLGLSKLPDVGATTSQPSLSEPSATNGNGNGVDNEEEHVAKRRKVDVQEKQEDMAFALDPDVEAMLAAN